MAHAAYDDLTTLDNLFFQRNTNNSTENEDIKAFLDLVKKMLTVDPSNRILPADALKHPFITMEHLNGASDEHYVRNARKLMKNVQPEKFPSDGETEISERPAPSQVPSVQTNLDRSLPKAEFDKSASSTVQCCLKESKGGKVTEKTSIDTREKNELLSFLKNEEAMCSKKSLEKTNDTHSTDSESLSSKLIPGKMIEGFPKVYIVEQVLGSGAYGAVARCRIQETNEVVALKITRVSDYISFFSEIKVLERLNEVTQYDSYFIRLNNSFAFQGFLYQEFELLDKDLCEFVENKGGSLKVAEIRAIAQQILVALSALKHLGITHADVKLDNIMLVNHKAQPFRVKLIDFGFACETETLEQKGSIQNLAYRAPEITLGLPRDEAIDTWSLGYISAVRFTPSFHRDRAPHS
uniref:Protein kinase domain-containing protein n=1 Tax=Nothobranchius furzeri TaxID=105023 RepID=A0A8C6PNU2_NOTFU